MSKFIISRGISLPTKSPCPYPFAEMAIGESFFAPNVSYHSMNQAIISYRIQNYGRIDDSGRRNKHEGSIGGPEFTCRRILSDDCAVNGTRVWRTA